MNVKDLISKHKAAVSTLHKRFTEANVRDGPKMYAATELVALPLGPRREFDEIIPRLILSNSHLARDELRLKSLGIKYVVNAAMGNKFAQIDTTEMTYEPMGIKFMGVPCTDVQAYNILQHVHTVADFIEHALQNEGKVMVFCQMGVSRSATLVIAYLMIKHKLHLKDAIETTLKKREIFPNDGFCAQLCELHEQLTGETLNL